MLHQHITETSSTVKSDGRKGLKYNDFKTRATKATKLRRKNLKDQTEKINNLND